MIGSNIFRRKILEQKNQYHQFNLSADLGRSESKNNLNNTKCYEEQNINNHKDLRQNKEP